MDLKVRIVRIEEQEKQLKSLASKIEQIKYQFMSISNNLDYDIKCKDTISSDIQYVLSNVSKLEEKVFNAGAFIGIAGNKYEQAENKVKALANSFNEINKPQRTYVPNIINNDSSPTAYVMVGLKKVGNVHLVNGTTTGNMTDIIEGLGGSVVWNETTRTATVEINGRTITYNLNDIKNGIGYASDGTRFFIENGKIQVGIRQVSEKAGANVNWHRDDNSGIVVDVDYTHAKVSVTTPVIKDNGQKGEIWTTDDIIIFEKDGVQAHVRYPIGENKTATAWIDMDKLIVQMIEYSFKEELKLFPESYRQELIELHKQHPEWRFYAENIDADFNQLIDAEMKNGHVCTPQSKYGYTPKWRDPKYKYDSGYYAASREATAYFIDPRNFISEKQIFQFFSAKYDKNTQNKESVQKVLGEMNALSNKADVFIKAGGKEVSAVFLASKAMIESGAGKSTLATGKVKGYEGWYNMYGIGAYDGNAGIAGAKKAKSYGWDTQDKAIIGGGNWIHDKYVSQGQDTLYKMKWNAEKYAEKGIVTHQYATHIKDAYNKADRFAKGLKDIDAPYVFRIPVYKNMTEEAAQEPTEAKKKQ